MVIGKLIAVISLDHPKRVYHGLQVPVTGHINLEYTPADRCRHSNNELFGPLRIDVVLYGCAKTSVRKGSGNNAHTYKSKVTLFRTETRIHDGAFTTQACERRLFHFRVTFPKSDTKRGMSGMHHATADVPDWPPSCHLNNLGGSDDAKVSYHVDVNVMMPGIQVKVVRPWTGRTPEVLYAPPATVLAHTVWLADENRTSKQCKIQNKYLLPEYEWPQGCSQKLGAFFTRKYYPQYHFELQITGPSHLYMGEAIRLRLSSQPLLHLSNARVTPLVSLVELKCSLESHTEVRAGSNRHSVSSKASVWCCLAGTPGDVTLSAGTRHSLTVQTQKLSSVLPSFETSNISRRYYFSIRARLRAAEKNMVVRIGWWVTVHPPLEQGI